MDKLLIAKKSWSNASAFIEVDPQSRVVVVYGKFYEDDGWRRRGYGGPSVHIPELLPQTLVEEVVNRGTWACSTPMSDELSVFCEKAWKKAKELEPWFAY